MKLTLFHLVQKSILDQTKNFLIPSRSKVKMTWNLEVFIFSAFLSFLASTTSAAPGPFPKNTPHVRASLVSEQKSISGTEPFWVALRLEMEDEWHTYWLNPGDSGAATTVDWKNSEGAQYSSIHWPTPEKLPVPPLVNYGYSDEVLLLTQVTPPSGFSKSQFKIQAKAQWLVCKEVCIPGKMELELTLPISASSQKSAIWSEKFEQTRKSWPKPDVTLSSEFNDLKTHYEIKVFSQTPNRFENTVDLSYFPLSWHPDSSSPTPIENATPQSITFKEGVLTLQLKKSDYGSSQIDRLEGVLVQKNKSGHDSWIISSPEHVTPLKEKILNWLKMVLFAFIGGFILNFMPCVFPVLSIKVLEVIKQSGKHAEIVRFQSLFFSLGMVSSFIFLGFILVLLRSAGHKLGWGFQLQSPLFVTFLATLFFAIGLNLMGFFEMGVSFAAKTSHYYQKLKVGKKWEPFFSGTLATLIATPCTAPFMGSALGFAITQDAISSLSIFAALGMGMALPYLILFIFPKAAFALPRPGKWMDYFKKVLSFPILATSAWLIWVLSLQIQSKPQSLIIFLVALFFLASSLYFLGRFQLQKSTQKPFLILMGIALMFLALFSTDAIRMQSNESSIQFKDLNWEKYSPERLTSLRKFGTPIFIDFTAAWCVTCQVNERLVLNQPEVIKAFKEKNIFLMKADWTSYDPVITEALNQYGRNGVPVYVLYPSEQNAAPLVLPEVITKSLVLDAIRSIR